MGRPGLFLRDLRKKMMSKKALLSTVVILAAMAACFVGYRYWQSSQAARHQGFAPRSVSVQLAQAVREDVPEILTALGTVSASETAEVMSQVQGRLTAIYFKEGSQVQKGALLAKIDTRGYEANLFQYEGSLAEAKAQLANARAVLDRYERLYKQDSLSRQDLDAQRAAVAQYEGAIKSIQGQMASANVSIGYGRVTAPISGYVGLRGRDLGNLVGPGDSSPIAVITQTSPISVEFSVPQASFSRVVTPYRAGEHLGVDVFDQDGKTEIASGVVSAVGNQIDTATGTVKVKSLFKNEDGKLFPNQFVNVKMTTGVLKNAVVVPTTAVQTGTSGLFVFTVGDDLVAHRVPVEIGPATEDGKTAILKGLDENARVVTAGVDSVSEGTKVSVIEPKDVDVSVLDSQPKGRGPRGRR